MITKETSDLAIKILMCVDPNDDICFVAREILARAMDEEKKVSLGLPHGIYTREFDHA